MSTIKDITLIDEIDTQLPEADTTVYVEHGGLFRRATPRFAREGIGLGGLAIVDGLLCMELDEES